jgi:hypothetical protein
MAMAYRIVGQMHDKGKALAEMHSAESPFSS